jgi:hypothetical protein
MSNQVQNQITQEQEWLRPRQCKRCKQCVHTRAYMTWAHGMSQQPMHGTQSTIPQQPHHPATHATHLDPMMAGCTQHFSKPGLYSGNTPTPEGRARHEATSGLLYLAQNNTRSKRLHAVAAPAHFPTRTHHVGWRRAGTTQEGPDPDSQTTLHFLSMWVQLLVSLVVAAFCPMLNTCSCTDFEWQE